MIYTGKEIQGVSWNFCCTTFTQPRQWESLLQTLMNVFLKDFHNIKSFYYILIGIGLVPSNFGTRKV